MKVGFNTSQTMGEKPNLYYLPMLSSNDYINVEEYLFRQQYYNSNYYNFYSSGPYPGRKSFV